MYFKIPKSFELMNDTINIKYSDKLTSEEDSNGRAYYRKKLIELQKISETNNLNEDNLIKTYLHELLHMILWKLEEDKLRTDEKLINKMAWLLAQHFKSAKYNLFKNDN